jgi:hypothetical protein
MRSIKNMKKTIFTVLVFALMSFGNAVFAWEATLEIRLFYNQSTDTVSFDTSRQPTIYLNRNKLTYIIDFDEAYQNNGPYEIIFLDKGGLEIDKKQFTPTLDSFTIEAPDYHITKTVAIRKTGSTSYLLKQDISQYISCNLNNLCEYEKNEDMDNCIPDCAGGYVQYSAQTIKLLDQGNGKILDPKTGDLLIKDRRPLQIGRTGPIPSPENVELEPTSTTKPKSDTEPEQTYTPTGYVPNQPEDTNTYQPGDNFNLSDQTPDNTSYTPAQNTPETETDSGMGTIGKIGIFFGVLLLLVMPPVLYFRFKKVPTGY